MPTTVGVIGCGSISRFHFSGLEKAGAKIAWVCDLNEAAARPWAEKFAARYTADYREGLADPTVALIDITTISSVHKEICMGAIAAGKAIICEKTLTDNPADSLEIAQAATQADTYLATAYMKRYFPAAQQAKSLLADMGQIISIHARSWQPWDLWNTPLDAGLTTHPSVVRRMYGGGVLVCAGSHILDLLHWFGGRPSAVCGDMHVREGMDIDNQANAMLWFENGGIAHLECCWHPLRFAGYEKNGWDERLEINTISGRLDLYTVMWDHPLNNGALLVHQDAATGKTTEYRYTAQNPFDLEIAEMLRCFSSGLSPSPSAWDGYVVDELIASIQQSGTSKQVVNIDWKF